MRFHKVVLMIIFFTGMTISAITYSLETKPSFDGGVLDIPELQIDNEVYSVKLNLIDSVSLTFQVDIESLKNITNLEAIGDVTASYKEGTLIIPKLLVGTEIYSVKLTLIDSDTLTTQVDLSSLLRIGNVTDSLFKNLDSVLAQKAVPTNTPEGLWLIYSQGSVEFSFDNGVNSGTDNKEVNLHAFMISVHLANDTGELRIEPASCVGPGFVNRAIHTDAVINQFSITFQQLETMSGTPFPYRAGDLVQTAGTDLEAFVDKKINVSIINNREMIFDTDFAFSDTEGSIQGSFSASFKGRKIADDFTTKLGFFTVNNEKMDVHCYTYANFTELIEGKSTVNDQVFITQDEFDFEVINVSSNLGLTDGISSMLYQKRGAFTRLTNGDPSFGFAEELVSIGVKNTSALFKNTSVSTGILSDIIDYSLMKFPDAGFAFEYSIDNGGDSEALTGTVEVSLW